MIRDSITCPTCGHEPALNRCWACGWTADADEVSTTDTTPPNRPRDTRLEDQRKADALPSIIALGWTVLDFEQGYRPDKCPKCKTRLPGGHSTRVPVGIGDQLCQGHGIAAWLEWKTDDNDQTEGQRAFGEQCARDGVPYAVVRTTAQAVEFLQGLRGGK